MEDILDIVCDRQERAHAEYHRLEDLELNCGTNMLSTQYRLRLEFICKKIANKEEVKLDDTSVEKLAKRHTTARDWLNKARRQAAQDIQEGTMDDFG